MFLTQSSVSVTQVLTAVGNCKREILAIWPEICLNINSESGIHLSAAIGRYKIDDLFLNSALQISTGIILGKSFTMKECYERFLKRIRKQLVMFAYVLRSWRERSKPWKTPFVFT